MVIACLVKEVQLTQKVQRMAELGLITAATVQVRLSISSIRKCKTCQVSLYFG
jgi:hypothetical protein